MVRQAHQPRRRRSQSQAKRGVIPNRVGIEHRPPIADEKTERGHWEGDTIIGANHFGAVVTYVDKASKFLVAQVMKKRTASELNLATHQAFSVIPPEFIQTFTFDNGKEFSFHETLSASLGVACLSDGHFWLKPKCREGSLKIKNLGKLENLQQFPAYDPDQNLQPSV